MPICHARTADLAARGRRYEDTEALPNLASMQTRPARSERAAVDLRRLVTGFVPMAPDVAIVGEVRDRDGLPDIPPDDCRAA